MNILQHFSFIAAAGLSLATAQPTLADDWVAERLRGSVLALEDGQWVPLQRGDVVSDDRYIKTLGNGRAQFTRGAETIDLAGHTMIQILDRDGQQFTNVHQHYGQVAVEAERRDVNHFAVVTPHMASIVKGTQFVVRSGSTGASVSVDRGQVNVADPKSGTSVDITPGQSASVDPTGSFTVSATGDAELPLIRNSAGQVIEAQGGGSQGMSTSSDGEANRGNGSGGSSSNASANADGNGDSGSGKGNSANAGNGNAGGNNGNSRGNHGHGSAGGNSNNGHSGENGNAGGHGNGGGKKRD